VAFHARFEGPVNPTSGSRWALSRTDDVRAIGTVTPDLININITGGTQHRPEYSNDRVPLYQSRRQVPPSCLHDRPGEGENMRLAAVAR
jgi:hypothetical protein